MLLYYMFLSFIKRYAQFRYIILFSLTLLHNITARHITLLYVERYKISKFRELFILTITNF